MFKQGLFEYALHLKHILAACSGAIRFRIVTFGKRPKQLLSPHIQNEGLGVQGVTELAASPVQTSTYTVNQDDRSSSASSQNTVIWRNRKLWYFIVWGAGLGLILLLTRQEPWQYYKEVVSKQAFEHAPYPLWCDNDSVVFFEPDSEQPRLMQMSVSGDSSGEIKEFPVPLTSTAMSFAPASTSIPLAVAITSDHQRIAAIIGSSYHRLIIWDVDQADILLVQAMKPINIPDTAQINAVEWITTTRLVILYTYTEKGIPNKHLGIALLDLNPDYLSQLFSAIPTRSGGTIVPSEYQHISNSLKVIAQDQDMLQQLPTRLDEGSDIAWTKCALENQDHLLCAFTVKSSDKNPSIEHLYECTFDSSGIHHPLKEITSIRLPDPEDANCAWTTDGTRILYQNSCRATVSQDDQLSWIDKLVYRILGKLLHRPEPNQSNVDIFSRLLASDKPSPIVTNADDARYPIVPQYNPAYPLSQPFVVFTCKMKKHGYNLWVEWTNKSDGSQHYHQLTAHLDAVHCPAVYWSKDRLCIGVCTQDPKDLRGHIKYRMRAIYVDKDTMGFLSAGQAPSSK